MKPPTQKERIKATGDLINSIGICDRISKSQFPELYELIENHPNKQEKLNNFDYLKIVQNPVNPRLVSLAVVYKDGTDDTISWRCCITKRGWTERQTINAGLRTAILPTILQFRKNHQCCANCKINTTNLEIDHCGKNEFADLAKAFIEHYELKASMFHRDPTTKLATFNDNDISNQWVDFHNKHGKLQPLCKSCHRTKTFGS